LDDKPVEDITSKGESSNSGKGKADVRAKAKARTTTQQIFAAPRDGIDINTVFAKVSPDTLELFITSLLAKVPPDALGLFIVSSGDLILVERAGEIILGRQTEDAGTSIAVDLTPYGGSQSGVSRQHAVLRAGQDIYVLQDLDSTNGTWLNEARLPPHISSTLKNGDMVRLGQVRMYVIFHDDKPG
jgi:hypothetical protein